MERRLESTLVGLAAIFALFFFTMPAAADWTQSYCSTQNTGSSSDVYNWHWQSNGNCTGHCNQEGTFAFAVIQYDDCWCSNYIPADQEDISKCQVDCPGYPTEKCGNKDEDLFIYIEMSGQPSGTQGGSQPTTSAAVSSAAPSSTEAPSSSSTSEEPEETSTTSETTSETTTAAPATTTKPTTTQEPMTMPTVLTESGVIVTRTVVVTPTSGPARSGSNENKSNVGAIAGGVAGGVVGLLAIVGLVFFLMRRKRQQGQQQGEQGGGASGISRNVSTMSRAGLLGGRTEKETPTPIITNFGSQRSRHDNDSISPMTGSTRRFSQPMVVDSRLNPNAVLAFHGANLSRESLGSIDDSRDYGRQLNVRNPDP